MEIIRRFKKNEKGSITIMVLTAMLFMLVVITISYLSISNESIGQNKKISQISEQYQVTDEDMKQEYQKAINSLSVKDYVKVGDYVDYEPTIATKDGQKVDESQLTYTSPTGTIPTDNTGIITHGNGYTSAEEGGGQTFTAKANDGSETGVKWRVLSVSDNKIELISEKPVLKDETSQDNGNFVLQGGIGYLYAEQELNEICKIYGYGYGADKDVGATYTVGGPEDTPIIGKIEGTGARSVTIDDLYKMAGIYIDKKDGKMKYSNGEVIECSYGETTNFTEGVFYPTLNSSEKSYAGKSISTKTGFKNTYFSLKTTDEYITDTTKINLMFMKEPYWFSSRSINCIESRVNFGVNIINTQYQGMLILCSGQNSNLYQSQPHCDCAVRPIVTLKADVIDLGIDYNKDNIWRLK